MQPEFTSREIVLNLATYRCLLPGLEVMKKLDDRVLAEFAEEFAFIAHGFLSPCTRLMKKIKGPRYTPPVFQNIKLPLVDLTHHDIIDTTQPSQHVPQPPDVAIASSSRAQKLPTRKSNPNKWDIKKGLADYNKDQIKADWDGDRSLY